MRWIGLCVLLASCGGSDSPSVWLLSSPSGDVVAEIEEGDSGLRYRVLDRGVEVVGWSPLGVETEAGPIVLEGSFEEERREIDESYTMLLGKRLQRSVRGNELALRGEAIDLVMRAHDDGVAFRYVLHGTGEVVVTGEGTGFDMTAATSAWLMPYDENGLFMGAYESNYRAVPVGNPVRGSGWAYPALFQVDDERWVLIAESDLRANYCGTRLHERPEGALYRVRFPNPREGLGIGEVVARAELPLETPWRVIHAGDLATIVESTLVDDLAPPSTVADTSWIRTGRAAWSWPTQTTGEPELQALYVDFAERVGWEHVLVDANWNTWADTEATVRALVSDANARGIDVWLWYNSGGEHNNITEAPRDLMLDPEIRRAEMQMLQEWGVAGIKIDFFQSDKQDRIQQYIGILEDAADHELMINFHGSTVPRGWQRTYPHLITMESVRGAEFFMFPLGPDAAHHVQLALTRNVVGSMDYTPTLLSPALDRNGQTYAHQLALAALYESGVVHFADRADGSTEDGYGALFEATPFAEEFMGRIPAVWDDTVLLDADPDSHVVLARRSGSEWWVTGISVDARSLSISLERLGGGFDAEIVTASAPDTLAREERAAITTLDLSLAANDGFIAVLR